MPRPPSSFEHRYARLLRSRWRHRAQPLATYTIWAASPGCALPRSLCRSTQRAHRAAEDVGGSMLRVGTTFGLPRAGALALMVGAALLASTLALAIPATPVRANGTPIRIVLSYLNGVSNFGPQNATGVSELITSEGEVRLTAAGLQKLADTEKYQLWIASSEAKEELRLGTGTVNHAG